MATLSFRLSERLYLRDPLSSDLGTKIVSKSIELIDRLGFEQFTFKKLADEIDSTEASVYRYFENKHRVLLYLIDWYWTWMDYRIDYLIHGMTDPRQQLEACIRVLAEKKEVDPQFEFVDEPALSRIVVAEFEKTYLTKQVDADNKEGVFLPFKQLCRKIAELVKQINPDFPYAQSLISTVIITANHQLYYAEHLPSLTNIGLDGKPSHQKLSDYLNTMVFKTIA